jgi:ribose transport system permease protein/erythritol transport system permease protein
MNESTNSTNPPAPEEKTPLWPLLFASTLGRFVALILVFLLFAVLVEGGKFCTPRNLENIARQSAVYATAALGMTLVIIAGGIDLSVGAVIALTVVATAWVLNIHYHSTPPQGGNAATVYLLHQWPTLLPLLAAAAGVLAATAAGAANGSMIVRLRIVPFIVTLGTMGLFRGLAKGVAEEKDIYPPLIPRADGSMEEPWITSIMDPTLTSTDPHRSWMLLPPGIWMLMVAAVMAALLLRYTRLGRHIFAIGSNEETARLCGVPVQRTKIIVYTLAGFFAGLAGLMQFSFIRGIGQPTTATAYELFVIAAVVIGGGSLMGGEGSILGSLIGALIITILSMGSQQAGWPKWVQEMVIGAIIIAAVTVDQFRRRRST